MITQGAGVHLLITVARRKNLNHWRSEKLFQEVLNYYLKPHLIQINSKDLFQALILFFFRCPRQK